MMLPSKLRRQQKEHAEAKSYKELGEITLDYYLKLEEIADEECDGTEL